MYEGRNAMLFHPTTAVITWMSNPAQPSFVWQIYRLRSRADVFLLRRDARVGDGAHPVQRSYRRSAGDQQQARAGRTICVAHVAVYNLDGSLAYEHETKLTAAPDVATDLGPIDFPATVSAVHFIKLDLRDAAGNCFRATSTGAPTPDDPDDFAALNQMPMVTLTAKVEDLKSKIAAGAGCFGSRCITRRITSPLWRMCNFGANRANACLPVFYSDNYVSLVPGETKTIDDRCRGQRF